MSLVRLLDFGAKFEGDLRLGRPRRLAWPVTVHRVQIPEEHGTSRQGLNPFERVLLELLAIEGPKSSEHLSKETCIPEDFVATVLLRLQDKQLIDDHNTVLKDGKAFSGKRKYKSAMIFQEEVGGKLLPFVLYDRKPETKQEKTGINLKEIRSANRMLPKVGPDEVLKAIKEQARHSRAFGERGNLPRAEYITVSPSAERYYLECPIGLRESDGEFRIANPFGQGFSVVLEEVFLNQLQEDTKLEEWLISWRESVGQTSSGAAVSKEKKEPYESRRCTSRYPKLITCLKPMRSGIRSIEGIYSSIEWALYYSNEQFSSRSAIQFLRITPQIERRHVIERAANELGLEVPSSGFPCIRETDLENYQAGVPQMPTALAISLLIARSEEKRPLRKFAQEQSDVAVRLFEIKYERDAQTHGKGRMSHQLPHSKEEAFMKGFISSLLPDLRFSEGIEMDQSKIDISSDERFVARSELLAYFGYTNFNRLICVEAQDRLVTAEQFWISFDEGENATPFLLDLYGALQAELAHRMGALITFPHTDQELRDAIDQKASNIGVYPLSNALANVAPHYIKRALQGSGQTTLGALAVSFLFSASTEELERIKRRDASFFDDVGEIISARGHGNEARVLTKEEVCDYRRMAYKALSALVDN